MWVFSIFRNYIDLNVLVINCGFPGYIENGQTSGFDYYFGDSILNSCNDGYKLSGQRLQSCLGNGSWSGEKPKCEGK